MLYFMRKNWRDPNLWTVIWMILSITVLAAFSVLTIIFLLMGKLP